MKMDEALPLLRECVGAKFGDLFSDLPENTVRNKGEIGQMLLLKIGLKLDSALTDLEDGEIKTNKSDENGVSQETMFITQISNQIDTLLSVPPLPFEESNFYNKIRRLAFLPVCRESKNNKDWFFVSLYNVNLSIQKELKNQLEEDYISICKKLRRHIEHSRDENIRTSSGQFIQNRTKDHKTKDSKSYHPIFSKTYGRLISNKNHAFYFRKEFMNYVRKHGR